MGNLDIAEVAQRSGVPASALRYYEEKGLIASTGFSLDEVASMFDAQGRPNIDRALLVAKADELDGAIRRLTSMRDGLRHAAACTAPSHMECPKFRRILRAASDARRARKKAPPPGG